MSIYPVRITEWYDDPKSAFNPDKDDLKFLLKFVRCNACGRKIRWSHGYVHHSITFGYGDGWCSETCLHSRKEYKFMTKAERNELNEMSKKIWGSSSRWQTLLNKGELVYNEKLKYKTIKRYTLEEIKAKLTEATAKPTMQEIADMITNSVKTEESKAE